MELFRGLFRNFLNSLIISSLVSLVGLSLFVGDFPPTVGKVKRTFAEYQSLIHLKNDLLNRNPGLRDEDFVDTYQKQKRNTLNHLVGANAAEAERTIASTLGGDSDLGSESRTAEMPKEWREQIYNLQAQVFRLNQRVIELEKRQQQSRR